MADGTTFSETLSPPVSSRFPAFPFSAVPSSSVLCVLDGSFRPHPFITSAITSEPSNIATITSPLRPVA